MKFETPSGASQAAAHSSIEASAQRPGAARSQLAADVHDGPLQLLAAAVQDLAEDDAATRARGRVLLGQAMRDLRELLEPGDGRPASWESRQGLEDWCALAAVRRPFGWAVHVGGDVGDDAPLAFAAARELITNAARHSHCAHLRVHIEVGDGGTSTLVEVDDDGDGFAPGTVPGFGLRSLERRLTVAGGRMGRQEAAGGGVHTHVRLPRVEAPT